MRMLCSFAFDEMGMHRVTLEVAAENTRARRCYEKAGFVECGTEHEVAWYHGRWNDCIRMEMLASDWEREKVDSDAKECADDMDVPEEESPKPSE
jgi:RimJ/RimL family protein N-acetyltransferase